MNRPLAIRALLCFVLVAGMFLTACTKKYVAAGGADVAGEYVLVSVDGKDMPATVSHGGVSLKVLSGAFTINADGTCSSRTVFAPPNGDEVEREVAATYTMVGSELTMQWEGAGMTVGTVEGNSFTMDNEGMVFVYKK
jgi:hypothetical protein